jgi:type III restriction enzyme
MTDAFFSHPILNSPYSHPAKHWELVDGQPTQQVIQGRRKASFFTPIPRAKKQGKGQTSLVLDEGAGLSTDGQEYTHAMINELRVHVDRWRDLKDPAHWRVTPETARLLQHWRSHPFQNQRPFFCQVEAIETLIWLTEVAPSVSDGKRFLDHLSATNEDQNAGLSRLALKLATGAGKTTVMAMLIAWQTINAARHSTSKRFTRGFLITAPGITIRDRLRVLLPNDPDSYYRSRELVPTDLVGELGQAKIVITNFHAFKLRERTELSKGGRALLQGHGPPLETQETEGQMLLRVMPDLMAMKNIIAINDEAHHCYIKRTDAGELPELKGDEKQEAEENEEAAMLWSSGLQAVNNKLGLARIVDLSATPFFLSGSGYVEGTLFPWTMSDFSLMDAIECGIVKLPRVPVADNIPEAEEPIFRELWKHISKKMPKKGRGKGEELDPLKLPNQLQTALEALYGHYEKTFRVWEKEPAIHVPPCFIVVCNNTASSKLVYDYISGFTRTNSDGSTVLENGRLALFRNFDEHGNPLAHARTLLIDSSQLESGDALDDNFRKTAAAEIEQFRREIVERSGGQQRAEDLTDQQLLREVMNTVGKRGSLGEQIRCVVSVSMLTEGWDANTVTHVLGVRAFGTQLLCEQVIGRALRRQSYEINPETGLFDVEYADVLGIPFKFTAKAVPAPPNPPRETIQVKAMPERAACEIRFPRVEGYRVELPEERLEAAFTDQHVLRLTPDRIGPTRTLNQGIIGEGVDLNLVHTGDLRQSTLLFHLTQRLLYTKWRDPNGDPKLYLFGQLKRVVREWLETRLECVGGTFPAQLMYQELADEACNRIMAGIVEKMATEKTVVPLLDPFNPTGSTAHVNFTTTKLLRWEPDSRRCHLNWLILDSNWEAEFCRAVEQHPSVRSYVKNHNLSFEVPYQMGGTARRYRPDFIVRLEDGHGEDDLLQLVVEIKGRRGEDAKAKALTMRNYWVPSVNNHGGYGRWAVAEFTDAYAIEDDFAATIEATVGQLLDDVAMPTPAIAAEGSAHA